MAGIRSAAGAAESTSAAVGGHKHLRKNAVRPAAFLVKGRLSGHAEPQWSPSSSALLRAESRHTFRANSADWGFSEFFQQKELRGEGGWLVDDTAIIRVQISIDLNQSGCYDSRKETGFVGLRNQGGALPPPPPPPALLSSPGPARIAADASERAHASPACEHCHQHVTCWPR